MINFINGCAHLKFAEWCDLHMILSEFLSSEQQAISFLYFQHMIYEEIYNIHTHSIDLFEINQNIYSNFWNLLL